MAIRRRFGMQDFERDFDEFFDELLIHRWKCGSPSGEFEHAQMKDNPGSYEVRFAAPGIDPARIDVEVSGQRLTVRIPAQLGGMFERTISFSQPIDGESSTAQWSGGTLVITLPKQKGRRIALKES